MKIGSSIEDLYNPKYDILKTLSELREVEFENLLTLKISEFAHKKVKTVVKSAFEALNHAVESYWLFLGDTVIQDIIIPYQHVSHAFVEVDGINILNLKKIIIESNLEILGWGHSHADFGVFFSGTDWRNQNRVFNETSNYVIIKKKKKKKKEKVSKDIIKYSYGSTFNIHEDIFVQLTWQEPGGSIQHSRAKLEIIPSNCDLKFDFKSFGREIHKYFSK
jgi:proteasome lid subunit RPN8/RPN11